MLNKAYCLGSSLAEKDFLRKLSSSKQEEGGFGEEVPRKDPPVVANILDKIKKITVGAPDSEDRYGPHGWGGASGPSTQSGVRWSAPSVIRTGFQ